MKTDKSKISFDYYQMIISKNLIKTEGVVSCTMMHISQKNHLTKFKTFIFKSNQDNYVSQKRL